MNKKLLSFLVGCSACAAFAQSGTNASGGNASGSGGSVSYSAGQVVYNTHSGTNGSSAQGVQQPYEISVIAGLKETRIGLSCTAFPNPTTDLLTLCVDNFLNQEVQYQLYDVNGKLIDTKKVTEKNTAIPMDGLAKSSYFLKITKNNKEVKTFKIILN